MKTCVVCGRSFEIDNWHPNQLTCSKQCNILRQRQKLQDKLAKRRIKVKYCEMCGKEFQTNKYNWRKAKWCSECRVIAIKEIKRKYQRLHPKLPRRQRQSKWGGNWWKAMERDKDTCQICGNRGVLVHHKDFSGERESPNHALENLQVLCGMCHWKLHYPTIRVDEAEKKIHISGLLFQVYSDYQIMI